MKTLRLLSISRPRFWIYVLGPYLVGLAAMAEPGLLYDHLLLVIVGLVFFTFPANILIYGVNDIFDYETDKENPKKQNYEELVEPKDHRLLLTSIALSTVPFLAIIPFVPLQAALVFFVFLVAGVFYSAPPLRAKAQPGLDILFSSVIYITPGVFGYLIIGSSSIPWLGIIAGLLWASAMQTYSAVPDIVSDTKADISTLATVLGTRASLWFCLMAYAMATVLASIILHPLVLVLGAVYVGMMVYSMRNKKRIFEVYALFPLVNTILGFLLFVLLLLQTFQVIT